MGCQEILGKYPWINAELFGKILNDDQQSIGIEHFEVHPAVVNGENYSSYLIKAMIKYTDKNGKQCKQLIIKAALGDKIARSRNVFAKEIQIYGEIIPRMQNILNIANIPAKLTPKYYHGDVRQFYLILEDLTVSNYENVARSQGLNFNQLKICLKTLAVWHAASVRVLHDTSLETYNLFLKPHVSQTGSPHYKTLFENAVSSCCQAFTENPDFFDIVRKLKQLKTTVFERCCATVERNPNTLNVLTHGDLWSNNIMFYKAQPSEIDPLFLDFQMSYFGSPMLDVSYLLFTSSSENIAPVEFDLLIDYYSNELIEVMTTLDVASSQIPTKQQLLDEFYLRGCYGAFFSLFSVPLRILPTTTDDNVNKFLSDSEQGRTFRTHIYANKTAQKILSNLLVYFNKKRFLN